MFKNHPIVFLILCLKIVHIQNTPFVPCPEIFHYITFGTETFGLMKLYRIPLEKIFVEIEFMQRESIATDFSGGILLNQNFSSARKNLESGEPISYRIDFPNPHIMPTLITINVNNKTICNGTRLDSSSNTFKLHHTFDPEDLKISTGSSFSETLEIEFHETSLVSPNTASPKNIICGRDDSTNLAFGDVNFESGIYPWLVAIFIKEPTNLNFTCNGSLISSRTVITAGKCFKTSILDKALWVFLGRQSEQVNAHRDRFISSLSVHFNFKRNSHADIILLHMAEPVEFNEYIKPICLWSSSSEFSLIMNQQGFMAGWLVDEDDIFPSITKTFELNINLTAQSVSSITGIDRSLSPNSDHSCIRSGSGLMVNFSGVWILGGILSTSDSCKHGKFIVSYDVSKYIPWIQQNMLS